MEVRACGHPEAFGDSCLAAGAVIIFILLMIQILHDLKDPKLWDGIFLTMGNAGFVSSTVVQFG